MMRVRHQGNNAYASQKAASSVLFVGHTVPTFKINLSLGEEQGDLSTRHK